MNYCGRLGHKVNADCQVLMAFPAWMDLPANLGRLVSPVSLESRESLAATAAMDCLDCQVLKVNADLAERPALQGQWGLRDR